MFWEVPTECNNNSFEIYHPSLTSGSLKDVLFQIHCISGYNEAGTENEKKIQALSQF